MKKIIYILILGLGFSSCGSDGGGGSDPVEENLKPSSPSQIYPSSNSLCIDNNVNFQWNTASDPNNDAVKYNLQIALDSQFSQIEQDINNLTGTSRVVSLDRGIAYYWRVKAIDSNNLAGDFSSNIQFYTEGDGVNNYLPFSPEIVQPNFNEVLNMSTTILEWDASDVDNDDLTYDVYFGTDSNSLPKESENQVSKTYEVILSSSTTYYWKIDVIDVHGGRTIGQTWTFKTE